MARGRDFLAVLEGSTFVGGVLIGVVGVEASGQIEFTPDTQPSDKSSK